MADEKKTKLTHAEKIFVRISVLQTVIAVVGIFTGAVALYAALNEADSVRKQQQAAVWPVLQMSISDYDTAKRETVFNLTAQNAGIGPARIAAFRVAVNGVPQANWDETFETLAGSHEGVLKSYFSGRVVSAGEEVLLVSAGGDIAQTALNRIYDGTARLDWDVCYCSVFDKCWVSGNKGETWVRASTPVNKCPDYGDEQFQG